MLRCRRAPLMRPRKSIARWTIPLKALRWKRSLRPREPWIQATALLLGPVAILLMPGELFADIALRLRRQSPYAYTLSCSLSDENLAYLVTREARHRGGYEVEAGIYADAYLLAENTDDRLVENYTALLHDTANCRTTSERTTHP